MEILIAACLPQIRTEDFEQLFVWTGDKVNTCSVTSYIHLVESVYGSKEVVWPWKEQSAMAQRQEFIQAILRENANIRAQCCEYGITPLTGYKWIKQDQAAGDVGLLDRSRRPQHSPNKSNLAIEEAGLKGRNTQPAWRGRKIYWKLAQEGMYLVPAASTTPAILHRHEMMSWQESDKHRALQRFEMEYPNR